MTCEASAVVCKLKLDVSADADRKVSGTYEGQCGAENVKGAVTGQLQPRPANKADGPVRLEVVSPG
jgi:hypothetical protein